MNKLQTLINPDVNYTLNDLHEMCLKSGFNITIYKLRMAVQSGKLKTFQLGGKGTDHFVTGDDAIAYFFS